MTRAHLSPLAPLRRSLPSRTMTPATLDTLRRMAERPAPPPHTFRTITGSDWTAALRRARSASAGDGNLLLRRLRTAVRAAEKSGGPAHV